MSEFQPGTPVWVKSGKRTTAAVVVSVDPYTNWHTVELDDGHYWHGIELSQLERRT